MAKILAKLNLILDKMFPKNWAPPQDLDPSKPRLFVGYMLAALVICVGFLTTNLLLGRINIREVAAAIGMTIATMVFKFTGSYEGAVLFALISGVTALSLDCIHQGGINSYGAVWFLLIPVASSLLLERRGIILGFVLTVLGIIAVHTFGLDQPTIVLSKEEMDVRFLVSIVAITTIIVLSYEYQIRVKTTLLARLSNLVEDKNNLVSIICHDIANPLLVMNNCAASLKLRWPKIALEKLRSKIEYMIIGGDAITNIIKNVRAMQAIDSGKRKLCLERVNLLNSIDMVRCIFEERLKEKRLTVVSDHNFSEIYVIAEKSTLEANVLSNLMTNAIKFSPRGGKLYLKLRETPENIYFSLRDEGIGMPKEIRENILSSTHPTTRPGTEGERGTGLGMPIVGKFIALYQAKINIASKTQEESPAEHGTTIEIVFRKAG